MEAAALLLSAAMLSGVGSGAAIPLMSLVMATGCSEITIVTDIFLTAVHLGFGEDTLIGGIELSQMLADRA